MWYQIDEGFLYIPSNYCSNLKTKYDAIHKLRSCSHELKLKFCYIFNCLLHTKTCSVLDDIFHVKRETRKVITVQSVLWKNVIMETYSKTR